MDDDPFEPNWVRMRARETRRYKRLRRTVILYGMAGPGMIGFAVLIALHPGQFQSGSPWSPWWPMVACSPWAVITVIELVLMLRARRDLARRWGGVPYGDPPNWGG